MELIKTQKVDFKSEFGQDIDLGLSANPKSLPSKYFYNKKGDKIFQEIMHMHEYYLMRSELEIFKGQKDRILHTISDNKPFRLLELGAGDGHKTKILLEYFLDQNVRFNYSPIDISKHVLELLENELNELLPELSISTLHGDYFEILHEISLHSDFRNVVFFLGSNIGNYHYREAVGFLQKLSSNLNTGDRLLIGFDLKKNPKTILEAYNDSHGITKRFNLNLLERINQELEADFDLDKFIHHPVYDPETGNCISYLISKEKQCVFISKLDKYYEIGEWEPIMMELSKKYNLDTILKMSEESGFKLIDNFTDSRNYFVDSVWEVK